MRARALVPAAVALAAALAALQAAGDSVRDRERAVPARPVARVIPPDVRFDQDFTDRNLVKMTITNYGFYGNNFFKRDASLEYPAGRGYEHMVRGGLWVGGASRYYTGDSIVTVTTGTVDAAQGPSSPEASEFTPFGKQVLKRSKLANSPFYDRNAVSELDVVSDFNDTTLTQAASNSERHRPLGIFVHHENFQWNFADFRHILFFRITVKNIGPLMNNIWIGLYSEFASGYKDGYVVWPPSSTDAGGLGSWFGKKWLVWDPADSLEREHYCNASPPPDNCIAQRAPYWIGLRYLGARGLAEDTTLVTFPGDSIPTAIPTPKKITVASWNWSPGNVARDQDIERYNIMSAGYAPAFPDSLLPGNGDPVELMAVGPFPNLYHDSTLTVSFAIVGGADSIDIRRHSDLAQFAFDNNFIIPVPPPSPVVHLVARDTALDVYWEHSPEDSLDPTSPNPKDFEGYRVYAGTDPDTMALVAQFDLPGDTASFNTGLPPPLPRDTTFDGVPGFRYKYSIRGLRNGFKYFVAVTSFDIGNRQVAPLESGFANENRKIAIPGPQPGEKPQFGVTVFPNPYRVEATWDTKKLVRDHYLWFANLPRRCTIRIFTLSGDLVLEKDFDGSSYSGQDARGTFDPTKGLPLPALPGSMYGWNMISQQGEAVATGLYLYSVEDKDGGKRTVGKFLIVKSDRESTQ